LPKRTGVRGGPVFFAAPQFEHKDIVISMYMMRGGKKKGKEDEHCISLNLAFPLGKKKGGEGRTNRVNFTHLKPIHFGRKKKKKRRIPPTIIPEKKKRKKKGGEDEKIRKPHQINSKRGGGGWGGVEVLTGCPFQDMETLKP